ncbi:alpha/beta hydrolase [Rathayibacter sp. Leaf248]|uniref:alpha/beta hydrolase n=1 Tax=Rathayibacter sp. Leaf248 TaxID=2876555 RepID=UPI001E2BFE94|nr:alpha/beta hydrolase [Rathayibacter sp. Leaf248]
MPHHSNGYISVLAPDVRRTPVRYRNRYGIEIAADLYVSTELDLTIQRAGVVIGPPHGGVKEQGPSVYAQQLAQRGLVALAFDPSYNGESSGEPRHLTSPELFAEDFSAGVDHLGALPYVDRDRIGVLGICGSGGFALSAAQVDTRIKAVVTSAMYDISGISRDGWQSSSTDDDRREALESLAEQRWRDVDSGSAALSPAFPDAYEPDALDPITAEFQEFYVTDRGHHERSIGAFTITSSVAHVNFGALRHLADVAPRPILFITGDRAHSRYFTDDALAQATGPTSLVVVPGARHIDLYDRTDLIPFDTISGFFEKALGQPSSATIRP